MKQMHRPLGGMVLAVCGMVAGCGSGDDGARLLASAKASLRADDFATAAIQLRNVLQHDPSAAEARFLLGRLLLEGGDAAAAEIELRRAAGLGHDASAVAPLRARALLAQGEYRTLFADYGHLDLPDEGAAVDVKVALASAHAMQGDIAVARALLASALARAPRNVAALLLDARFKAGAGDVDGALRTVDGVLADAPRQADVLQLKGDLLRGAKGDLPAAAAAYRLALALRPNQPELHAALVATALQQHDVDGAARQLEQLRKLRPEHAQTRYFDAELAFARGDFAAARSGLQQLMRVAPDDTKVLYLAGATELQLGSIPTAEALLGRVLRLAPRFTDARRLLAQAALRAHHPAKALEVLRPALDAGSPTAMLLTLAGQAALLSGDAAAAQRHFAQAARQKPDDVRLQAALALWRVEGVRPDAALLDLEGIAAADAGVAVDLALISARLQRHETGAALEAIRALERKLPESPVPADLRGRAQRAANDATAARRSFEAALVKEPDYLPAASDLAALDVAEGRPEAALGRFETLLRANRRNAPVLLELAALEQRIGRPNDDVARRLAEAVAADPTDPTARLAQIDQLRRLRRIEPALVAAQRAAAALPDDPRVLEQLGRTQLAAGDWQQAINSFGKIVTLLPEAPTGYLGRAEAQLANQNLDAAAREVRAALDHDMDSVAAQRLALTLALRQQRPQDALALARTMQTRHPGDALGFVTEGEVELSQKHFEAAAVAFRKALSRPEPDHAAARLHTTLLAARRGAEAERFANGWLASRPQAGRFASYLGDAAVAQGDYALAQSRYADASRRQPDDASPLNNIAWLLLKQNKPGALDYAERARRLAPADPAVLDTLATVLATRSEHGRAIEIEKQAIAQAPDQPALRLTLARLCVESGDKRAAKIELERLAKLGPAYAGQPEVQRLMKLADAP